MDFVGLIERESKVISALHQDIHTTFKNRSKDRETWSKACERFNSHVSAMDVFINRIYDEPIFHDEEILEFGITFLELDPKFFRSGYIKEEILTKLKRSRLSNKQIARLRTVLLNAVENRGSKEFKYYCRLAGFIADTKFIDQLKLTEAVCDGKVKYRSKKMLNTIVQSQAHNKFKNETASDTGRDAQKDARPF